MRLRVRVLLELAHLLIADVMVGTRQQGVSGDWLRIAGRRCRCGSSNESGERKLGEVHRRLLLVLLLLMARV